MDGLLIVDKPVGPSSHDLVVRVRRAIREKRIGHTGTLDPMASGVMALVLGRATRLARYLSGDDKTYEAEIRLGFATDTYDAKGTKTGADYTGAIPDAGAIERALDAFRGAFVQTPPSYSAKMIDGTRSYKLARAAGTETPTLPAAVEVVTRSLELLGLEGDRLRLRVCCTAGFYMRSLAHDLGARLGTGAHLTGLRRTAAGAFTLAQAVDADLVDRYPDRAAASIVPMSDMLPGLPVAVLTDRGTERVAHGRDIELADVQERRPPTSPGTAGRSVRLIDRQGRLVAVAEERARPGVLHPSVVLM